MLTYLAHTSSFAPQAFKKSFAPFRRGAQTSWRALFCAIVLLCAVSCGGGNTLGGSMDTVFSLNFDAIEITYQQTSIVVQYTRGADVTCQLVIDTAAVPLAPNATLSGAPFVQAVSLYRAAASGGSFPAIMNGTLNLGEFGTATGSAVSGKFNATLADGHTLIGAFDGAVKAVVR